ncbi:Uncharacterised protein [Mycobacteroides abscessus]|nr:Uncharacterised protein [Mycobacteroides abscessus]
MTEMFEVELNELRTWFGFGVAGNFAGHLEQAGESADFVNVVTEPPPARPRPRESSRGTYPVPTGSSDSSRSRRMRRYCPRARRR